MVSPYSCASHISTKVISVAFKVRSKTITTAIAQSDNSPSWTVSLPLTTKFAEVPPPAPDIDSCLPFALRLNELG